MPDDRQQQNAQTLGWGPILFLSIAAVSAVGVLGARSFFPGWHGIPNTPLTTLFLLAGVAVANTGVSARYKWSIVAGLGFSALGDLFLMLPGDHFVPGLGSFLVAHVCYLWAFTHDSRLWERRLPFVMWGLVGVALLFWLWPGVPGPLRLPVVLYTVAILVMAAQATSRALSRLDMASILAAVGAALFVASDAVLAWQRFRHPLDWGRLIVLGTYFAAQSGIALSVVLHLCRAR